MKMDKSCPSRISSDQRVLHVLKSSSIRLLKSFLSSLSQGSVLIWLNQSLLPRLLDDSVLLRDTGSVLLGPLRLRQTRDKQGEVVFTFACCFV